MIQNISDDFKNMYGGGSTFADNLIEDMRIQLLGCGVHKTSVQSVRNFLFPAFMAVSYRRGTVELCHKCGTTVLKPGSFYIFRPYEIYNGVRLGNDPIEFSFLQFDIAPFMERFNFDSAALSADDAELCGEKYGMFGSMLEKLTADGGDRDGRAAMLRLLAKMISAQIVYDRLGRSGDPGIFKVSRESKLIDRAFQYVSEHMSEPIVIGKIVRYTATSKTSLDRAFRSVLNMTPQQSVIRFKAERSLEMLHQNIPLKIIAKDLGFSSVYHFSNTFKSVFGIRPTEFRKQNQLTGGFAPDGASLYRG